MANIDPITVEETSGFPIPFTLSDFKEDILETMLTLLNQTRFTFFRNEQCESKLWSLISNIPLEYPGDFAWPDNGAKDLNLKFSDIENIGFVGSLVQFYNYGMLGLLDNSLIEMDDSDGVGNWTSRILFDLHGSKFLEDWSAHRNIDIQNSVTRCLLVCELANARLMLEGGKEGFYLGSHDNCLDIRQMSLLAGMTEGSVRTLAGPNRKNALITTKNHTGTGIHIEIENAKAWLKSKGRYVPIRKTSARGAEDFTIYTFTSITEFRNAVYERRAYLNIEIGEDVMNTRLINAGLSSLKSNPATEMLRWDLLSKEQLLNSELMTRLGEVLELPKELFALRAAEAVANERLANIEYQIKEAQQSK